jgi:hypothetical protein
MVSIREYHCHQCGCVCDARVPGIRESCPKCQSDLHACLNCLHYDPRAYNECREPNAERVLEKARYNYCDYFSFVEGPRTQTTPGVDKAGVMKSLDDLFKK